MSSMILKDIFMHTQCSRRSDSELVSHILSYVWWVMIRWIYVIQWHMIVFLYCKRHIDVINAIERYIHSYIDTVAGRAAAKLQPYAQVGTAFRYVTHDQLPNTHNHILPYSGPGVGRVDPHIMAHMLTVHCGSVTLTGSKVEVLFRL